MASFVRGGKGSCTRPQNRLKVQDVGNIVWSSWTISRSFTPGRVNPSTKKKRSAELYISTSSKLDLWTYIFLLFLKFFEAFITFIYEECRHSQIVTNHLHGFITFLYASVAKINSCMSWVSLPNFMSERRWLVEKSWKTWFPVSPTDFDLEVAARGNRGSHKDFGLTFEPAKGLHQTLKLICIYIAPYMFLCVLCVLQYWTILCILKKWFHLLPFIC